MHEKSKIYPLGIRAESKQNYIIPIESDEDSSQHNTIFESDEDTSKKELGQKCPYIYRACCLGAQEYHAVFMLW